MSDPLSHATQGALMLLAPVISKLRNKIWLWLLVVLGGAMGALPDLLGLYGFAIRHDHGDLYWNAHHGLVKDALQYLPMYALHLAVDSLTHDPDRDWYGWKLRIWLQIIFWLLNGLLIAWFVRIWNANVSGHKRGVIRK